MGPFAWVGLSILGIALLWTINLTFTNRPGMPTARSRPKHSIPLYAFYVTAWWLILVGIVWPATLLSYGIGASSLIVLGMIVHLNRQQESGSLLWLLGLAVEKEIPVHRMARAFADERCDELGQRAIRVATHIEQGMPMPDAFAAVRYQLPTRAQLALNIGASPQETGTLLRETASQERQQDATVGPVLHQLFYFGCLSCVTLGIVLFTAITVRPILEQIRIEFDMPPNDSVTLMARGIDTIPPRAWKALSLCGLAFVGFGLVISVFYVLGILGWTRWEPFLVRRVTRRYHASIILRALASQVRADVPLPIAIREICDNYPRRQIRERLESARTRIERGETWQHAMRTENLINRGDASLLTAAERANSLPWALDETAEGILRRLRYRLGLWGRLCAPIPVILIALVVGVFGSAIFSTLTGIVEKLASGG